MGSMSGQWLASLSALVVLLAVQGNQVLAQQEAAETRSSHHLYLHRHGGQRRLGQAPECICGPGTQQCTAQLCNSNRQGTLPGACIGTGAAGLPAAPKPPLPLNSTSNASVYINETLFQRIFPFAEAPECTPGFYTYSAFKQAVASFPRFATQASHVQNKRELAAFLAQIAHETSGGWPTAPGGPYAWGLCFKEQGGKGPRPKETYCVPSARWPCARGKTYWGRGPMQLSYNYNYGMAAKALGVDILAKPELVAQRPVLAFRTALWFWMTPQGAKPSCHAIMSGNHTPTAADVAAKRQIGFGWTTNIINGGLECGKRTLSPAQTSRIGHFRRIAALLGVRLGTALSCATQKPY